MLEALFQCVTRHGNRSLENRVGTMLYRFHEAQGHYESARGIIQRLLERARETANGQDVPVLTSNLGYEYLLERRWAEAEHWFDRALALFERAGATGETLNVRTNLLECRFGRTEPASCNRILPELRELNRALMARNDWRARKTLRLLARFAENRGRRSAAKGWMRRALVVSEGIHTQLREWDQAYLKSLEGSKGSKARTASACRDRHLPHPKEAGCWAHCKPNGTPCGRELGCKGDHRGVRAA